MSAIKARPQKGRRLKYMSARSAAAEARMLNWYERRRALAAETKAFGFELTDEQWEYVVNGSASSTPLVVLP